MQFLWISASIGVDMKCLIKYKYVDEGNIQKI